MRRRWNCTKNCTNFFPILWFPSFAGTRNLTTVLSYICRRILAYTHSGVLAWRIPGTGEPGGLPSMGSHRVGHDWSGLAATAAYLRMNASLNLTLHRNVWRRGSCTWVCRCLCVLIRISLPNFAYPLHKIWRVSLALNPGWLGLNKPGNLSGLQFLHLWNGFVRVATYRVSWSFDGLSSECSWHNGKLTDHSNSSEFNKNWKRKSMNAITSKANYYRKEAHILQFPLSDPLPCPKAWIWLS